MSGYEHVLVAVDLSETSESIILRAQQISTALNCKLSMMQSLENFPVDMPTDLVPPEGVDKAEWFKEYAYDRINEIANSLGIKEPDIHPTIGAAKDEILEFAKNNNIDLIVVGSHERHGLSLLLKSTTDGVVHNAPCDVLAVHC